MTTATAILPPLWTSDAIAAATRGVASAPFAVEAVTFDSREVIGGELFIALRGGTTDGHRFIDAAHARGAEGFLVEQPCRFPHVHVADGFAALEDLGRAARQRTAATIIGVTGSVGKTGTKEALRRAFQRMAPDGTHWSEKSYNNHSGVPLSLARMPAATRYGVFEMGMNHAGEIRALTNMVRPHIALVTWIADAHVEHLGSMAGVAAAKAEIFEGVAPGGVAVWPIDSPEAEVLHARIRALGLDGLSFGRSGRADVRALDERPGPLGTEVVADVAGEHLHFTVGMAGAHWVHNALGVLAAVKAAGGDLAEAGLALSELTGLAGRGARVEVDVPGGRATIIDESYNANPASMAAALAVLGAAPGRRLALLGAMRELGRDGPRLHAALAGPIGSAGIAGLALVGAEMDALDLAADRLPDADAALRWVRANLRAGDVLLVKGSNSIGLGRVVAGLQQGDGQP
jgi:UDP-N-acetylmuramoyl-tripeptide--D-alanyl-D-alanine ligase